MTEVTIRPRAISTEIAKSARTQTQRYFADFRDRALRQVDTKKGIAAMHRRLAEGAQDRIIQAYDASGIGGGKPYRHNEPEGSKLKRYANGAMKRGLKSPEFYFADDKEIRLINRKVMDRAAKQWYRLNFGAAPRGSSPPNVGNMSFFGRKSGAGLSLSAYGPSEGFNTPNSGLGVWSTTALANSLGGPVIVARNGQYLYVVTKGMTLTRGGKSQTVGGGKQRMRGVFKPVASQGIQGVRFLDEGIRYLNTEYPDAFTAIALGWIKSAKRAGKL